MMIVHLKELLQMPARQVVLHPLAVYGRSGQSVCVAIQLHIHRHSITVSAQHMLPTGLVASCFIHCFVPGPQALLSISPIWTLLGRLSIMVTAVNRDPLC